MNPTIQVSLGNLKVHVTAQPLTQEAYAAYGDVVANPRPRVHPSSFSSHAASLPENAVSANQGSAIQYRNVSRIRNLYHQAPSGKADPVMSIFSCSARQLGQSSTSHGSASEFPVRVLERHPFTTQTFTPIESSASGYLVIVAPSLPPAAQDHELPVPTGDNLPGRGLPDVRQLKAFIATRSQAVTYGAGTWHAPMAALGPPGTKLDFVVSQFMSGEGNEDCQLVEFGSDSSTAPPNIRVVIPNWARLERL